MGGAVGRRALWGRRGPTFIGALRGKGQPQAAKSQRGTERTLVPDLDLFSRGTGSQRSQREDQEEQSPTYRSSHTCTVPREPSRSLSRAIIRAGVPPVPDRPSVLVSQPPRAVARVVAEDLPAGSG